MSNTCEIKLTIRHNDPEKMDKVIKALNSSEFLEEMLPLPEGQDACDYYGTWWMETNEEIENEIESIYCTSANVPPLAFFDMLTESGYYIEAIYYEAGCMFYGYYNSNDGTTWVDYTDEDEVPEEIINEFSGEYEKNLPEEVKEMMKKFKMLSTSNL